MSGFSAGNTCTGLAGHNTDAEAGLEEAALGRLAG
jgi:hypothetical protein